MLDNNIALIIQTPPWSLIHQYNVAVENVGEDVAECTYICTDGWGWDVMENDTCCWREYMQIFTVAHNRHRKTNFF